MRRLLLIAPIVTLLIATGIPLLRSGVADLVEPVAYGNSLAAIQTGRSFYAAMDTFFRDGRDTDLGQLISANFVDQDSLSGFESGKNGFVDELRALRFSFSSLQLDVLELTASDDLVTARLRATGQSRMWVAGMRFTIPPPQEWTQIEVLRLENGQVVERWTSHRWSNLLWLQTGGPVGVRVPRNATIALSRLTIDLGSSTYVSLDGPGVAIIQSGSLSFMGNGLVRTGTVGSNVTVLTEPGVKSTLSQGNLIAIPTGRLIVRNPGPEPAVVLRAAFVSAEGQPDPAREDKREGTTRDFVGASPLSSKNFAVETLAEEAAELRPGDGFLEVAQIEIQPGGELIIDDPGAAMLVLIETGSIERRSDGIAFSGGQHFLLQCGQRETLRNLGPDQGVLLVLRVT